MQRIGDSGHNIEGDRTLTVLGAVLCVHCGGIAALGVPDGDRARDSEYARAEDALLTLVAWHRLDRRVRASHV